MARSSRSEARAIDGQRRSRGSAMTSSRSGTRPSRSASALQTPDRPARSGPRSARRPRPGPARPAAAAPRRPRRPAPAGHRPPQPRGPLGVGLGLAAQQPARQPGPHGGHRRGEPVAHRRRARARSPRRARAAAAATGWSARPAGWPRCAAPPGWPRSTRLSSGADGVPEPVDVEHRPGHRVRRGRRAASGAPVSSASRNSPVTPATLTARLVSAVATISRRSGWLVIAVGKRVRSGRREVVDEQLLERRVVGQRRSAAPRRRSRAWRRRAAPTARGWSAPGRRAAARPAAGRRAAPRRCAVQPAGPLQARMNRSCASSRPRAEAGPRRPASRSARGCR